MMRLWGLRLLQVRLVALGDGANAPGVAWRCLLSHRRARHPLSRGPGRLDAGLAPQLTWFSVKQGSGWT